MTGHWITTTGEEWGDNFFHIHRAQFLDIHAHIYTVNQQTRKLTLITP
jgi:hypothetical protein